MKCHKNLYYLVLLFCSFLLVLLLSQTIGATTNHVTKPSMYDWWGTGPTYKCLSNQCTIGCVCNPSTCPGCSECCYYWDNYPVNEATDRPYDRATNRRYWSNKFNHYDVGRVGKKESQEIK